MIRVAFIGCGMVSELHQLTLAGSKHMSLVGLHDIDAAQLRRRAADWNVKTFDSGEAVFDDPDIDAVFVLTPAEYHVPLAQQALSAGKHVFVEKPVATDPAEIDRLVRARDNAQRVVMPGHNYAYIPEFQRIVRLTKNGDLGQIRAVFIQYVIKHPEEVAAAYGGVLEEVMIHHTYMTLALLGAPERVYAGAMEPAWKQHPVEDQAWMTWEYPGGTSAHLFATFGVDDDSADPWTFVVKVLGTEGSASMSWRTSIFKRALGTLSFAIPAYEESYGHEVDAFARAIAEGEPLVSTLADAAISARIIESAYDAARSGTAQQRVVNGVAQW